MTTGTVRGHADTALPVVVSAEEWQAAREGLLIAEEAHTHAGDAVSAQRRRMPMTEVDATLEATGPEGPTSLLEMFEGRRQLIVYHHMLKPDDEHPCPGCSAFTDHVPQLAHLHVHDVTFANRNGPGGQMKLNEPSIEADETLDHLVLEFNAARARDPKTANASSRVRPRKTSSTKRKA